MIKLCPICGNELSIKQKKEKTFRCRYCKKLVNVKVIQKKSKRFVELEEFTDIDQNAQNDPGFTEKDFTY